MSSVIPLERSRGMLRASGLVKRYRERTVVNDVSVSVHPREIVGLLGPNGAGKTTTFYIAKSRRTPSANAWRRCSTSSD